MNVSDVLTASLGMLGVLREGETPSAEQGADGLKVFNDYVASLRENGIELPLPQMSDTTTTFQLNEGDTLALKCLMAIQLQPFYPGRQPNPITITMATNGYDRWLRNAINNELQPKQMNTISKGIFSRRVNILTGV